MSMLFFNSNPFSLPQIPLYVFCIFFFSLIQSAHPTNFTISRFDPGMPNIIYEGDAIPTAGAVDFNILNFFCRVGRATYAEPVHLWDSTTGKLSDFTTHFSFTIDTLNASIYASGLAFYLAPVDFPIPPNSPAGFLGLFNTTTSDGNTTNQIVVVEFDTIVNVEWDPPVQHVGINVNSISSVEFTSWNASLHSGETATARVDYNASTLILSVLLTYEDNPTIQENYSISHRVDLTKILPEWVTVGFSAATSFHIERHTLHSWTFTSSLDVNVMETKHGKIRLIVGLAVSMGALMGVVGIAWVIVQRRVRRKKIEEMINLTSMYGDFERGTVGPKKFSYRELASATNNFSNERKLGQGGFGGVYKGVFSRDLAVAVKKISKGSKQGKKEYITEVKIFSRLRHRNLVQLIGWCHDRGEFLLVYEFMPNGSLDSHLFGNTSTLIWAVRYKIALGLASALLYLHEEWEQCVVHRDIKASNVMLDSSFNAKLGDFGLAKLMDHELEPPTTGLAGTLGYLAPEYIRTGKASKESDVFSFGVVALEIACGRKSINIIEEESGIGLVEWVWQLYGRGNLVAAMDEKLGVDLDVKQMESLMIVGLWCAHPDHSLRPSIKQAIQVLNFVAETPNLPNKMPVPIYHVTPPAPPSQSSMTYQSFAMGR